MKRDALLAMVVCLAMVPMAAAQNMGAHLTDGPAILDYTTNGIGAFPASSNGAAGNVPMNFQVHGVPNDPAERQVFSGNWFYRVQGDDRERHLINPDIRSPTGSNQMNWHFSQIYSGPGAQTLVPALSAEMGFQVGSTGPDSAYFYTYLCFFNAGPIPINVDVFFAADIDLGGTFGGDIYSQLVVNGAGRTWNLTDGSSTGIMFGPGADAAGVGPFGSILGAMTNNTSSTFMGDLNPGGLGPADLAGVMQFQETIPPLSMICFPCYVAIGVNGAPPIIPAPGAFALLGLGGLAAARRRRA